jgi:hypothetical protein
VRNEPPHLLHMQLLKRGQHQDARVRVGPDVEVATIDRWIHLWDAAGNEVRIGPLTAEQAEKLSEDLGYDAVD